MIFGGMDLLNKKHRQDQQTRESTTPTRRVCESVTKREEATSITELRGSLKRLQKSVNLKSIDSSWISSQTPQPFPHTSYSDFDKKFKACIPYTQYWGHAVSTNTTPLGARTLSLSFRRSYFSESDGRYSLLSLHSEGSPHHEKYNHAILQGNEETSKTLSKMASRLSRDFRHETTWVWHSQSAAVRCGDFSIASLADHNTCSPSLAMKSINLHAWQHTMSVQCGEMCEWVIEVWVCESGEYVWELKIRMSHQSSSFFSI